jgi:hypothetical protein
MCPSSRETAVFMQHLVLVWILSGMQSGIPHSRPKHAEKRNKHAKKNCAPSWLYLHELNLLQNDTNT